MARKKPFDESDFRRVRLCCCRKAEINPAMVLVLIRSDYSFLIAGYVVSRKRGGVEAN